MDTDGVKLYCTTMGKNVADRAMQVRKFTHAQRARVELAHTRTCQHLHMGASLHALRALCADTNTYIPKPSEFTRALLQVMGGYGYMGEYVVERLWRDAKLLEIGGGASKNACNWMRTRTRVQTCSLSHMRPHPRPTCRQCIHSNVRGILNLAQRLSPHRLQARSSRTTRT